MVAMDISLRTQLPPSAHEEHYYTKEAATWHRHQPAIRFAILEPLPFPSLSLSTSSALRPLLLLSAHVELGFAKGG